MAKTIVSRLIDKLSPAKVRVSPKFHAILACMLGTEGWSIPELSALTVTSDGFLLACRKGDIGFNDFLGTKEDLDNNLRGVADAVKLTKAEKEKLMSLSPVYRL